MILKASQRAGGTALALHLLRQDENDHVTIHQVRGFVRNNVLDAFKEAYAISRGTKCRQFLFSLSLSPPSDQNVPVSAFEEAINKIETYLGLVNQPRAIVFHEKNGRRHAHCVWSRIDPRTMKARQMGHFKLKLTQLSRELYLEHGWKMPSGLAKTEPKNPLNFTLAEWQQAKRIGRDPSRVKEIFKECWAMSDSGKTFGQALEARGYYLARGDRRGFVAVDWKGEIYSISRWCQVPTKLVKERLGLLALRPADAVRKDVAAKIAEKLKGFSGELAIQFDTAQKALAEKRNMLVSAQRMERLRLEERLSERWQREEVARASKLRSGLKGLWDWLTGRRAKTIAENELEIAQAKRRDADERQALIERQMAITRSLQREVRSAKVRKERHAELVQGADGPLVAGVPTRIVPARQGRYRKPTLER
ncbi:relaxase/mobilization nuclease domain-containing protein [Roseovarius sp.]|uniref:relaxase/mobilization nuclease domain-containing protein n=1 Tax=Roseovarius sp. TaxID=1486281 RepID=UPI003A96956D